jgi:predicted PurR-regulated permease PerM
LSLALIMGVVAFAMVVGVVHVQQAGSEDVATDLELARILSMVNALLFLSSFPLAVLFHRRTVDSSIRRWLGGGSIQRVTSAIRRATLVRGALLEVSALFGLVVCLLGTIGGWIADNPGFWLNSATAGVFVLYGLANLPTRDRIHGLLESRAEELRYAR